MENKITEILTVDYVFIPYQSEKDINIREDGIVYKDDVIILNDNIKEYSPISGIFNSLGEINTTQGIKKVIIIENNFKDSVEKKKISKLDIYELKSDTIKKIWKPKSSELYLKLEFKDNYDLKDEFILNDNISKILQTLDILDQTYPAISVKIALNKNNLRVYQKLFSYLGTYPNIIVELNTNNLEGEVLNLYEVLDIYNDLKNCNKRDYIYFTIILKDEFKIIKTKKHSNLRDILESLNINSTTILINEKLKLSGVNFLLDESVYKISIK